MKMKKFLSLCVALCMAASLSACNVGNNNNTSSSNAGSDSSSPSGQSMTLRFATDSSEDYVSTVEIYKFAEEVKEKTDGRITIEVYAGGQLGEEKSCVEQVQMGSLDFTKASMGALTSFNDTLNVLGMPYLFKSEDHLWKVMDSDIGQQLLDSMNGTGLVGIGWLDAGSRCFYAKTELTGPESFKGLKIRVMQSPIYASMMECLGASPISMSGNDVYSALQTGVVDGAENNIPRIIDMSHNEQCGYLILDAHNIMPEMVLVSESVWNKLDDADQQIILECAANLQDNMVKAWADTENEALETLKAGGMSIYEPDAATLAEFRAAMQPVYDEYGADYADLIAAIEDMA